MNTRAQQLEKLQAFVLSSQDYGESDRIVSLFSLEQGHLRGFARGARNSRKRFGPSLETFARIELVLNHKEGLSALRSADVITLYSGIRGSLCAIAQALYACELVGNLTPEGQPIPRLFRLMATYFEYLDTGQGGEADRRMFEINLLNILGYRPNLEGCSRCGADFDVQGALLQQRGELACRFCAATGRNIPLTALKRLGLCLATSRFGQAVLDEETLLLGGLLLDEAIASLTPKKLRSLEFLHQSCGLPA